MVTFGRISVLLSTQTKEQKERGRPGNEANIHIPHNTHTHTATTQHTSSFGAGNSIFLSILPGLKRAGSRMSIRLVAMTTFMLCVASNPSNWFNNSSMVRCTSLSPGRRAAGRGRGRRKQMKEKQREMVEGEGEWERMMGEG